MAVAAAAASVAAASSGSHSLENLPPAHAAASCGDLAELKRLYSDNRYRPAKSDPCSGETPMHAAVRGERLEALNFLLENNYIDPQARAKNGETAAHIAACEGWLAGLQALCNYDKRRRVLIITDQDLQGLTPLHIAIISCKEALVEWILDNFTKDQLKLMERGSLAVHFAAASGNVAILKMLVRHTGVECAALQDENGTTPVYFAAQEGQVETLKYLIVECGVDGRAKSNDGMQPIHAATQNGRVYAVKYLVGKMGRSLLQERTNDGATPIHFAAAGGHTDILKWMLNSQNGSVLAKVCDSLQSTPAHDAVDYGHLECLKVLLKHNADLFAMDDDGTSPYSLAMGQQDSPITEYVKENVRTRRLKPPPTQLPLSSEWDDAVYQPISPTSHPSIPATGSNTRQPMSPSGAAEAAAAGHLSVQTLDSQGDEIRAAQQQVMAHRLSTALEVVSEQQSADAKRPVRKRSVLNDPVQADPNLRHGETVAAALALKASRSPNNSSAVAASASGEGWSERPIVHRIGNADVSVPGDDSESGEEDGSRSDTPGTVVRSEERRDPDGQEHGVDSWFADGAQGRERSDTISDRPPMSLPTRPSIDDPDVGAMEEDEDETPRKRHVQSTTSWYSSDGEPLTTSSQYSGMKKQQHRSSGRHGLRHGRSSRKQQQQVQYMPVFQPMMTPYGPMMTQTFMPVPRSSLKGMKGSRRTRSSNTSVSSSTAPTSPDKDKEKDQDGPGSRPSLDVVSEEDEFETVGEEEESVAESTLPRPSKGERTTDADLPAKKRQRGDMGVHSGKRNTSRRRSSTSPYGVFSLGGGGVPQMSTRSGGGSMPGMMPSMPSGVMAGMPAGMMGAGMGGMPPGMMAPGMGGMPPGMMAPGMGGMPPGMMAPGMGGMPPGMMAPRMGGMPPGMMAPGMGGMPMGMMAPGMGGMKGMMPMMPGPNGKGFNMYGRGNGMMAGGMFPMRPGAGTMPNRRSPKPPPVSAVRSPTLPPRRASAIHRILGKRNSQEQSLGAAASYDGAPGQGKGSFDFEDDYELPMDYKKGSTIAEIIINTSVISLGVIAGIPRVKQPPAKTPQPAEADSNFLLGNSSSAGLGEPMSLAQARLLSKEDSTPYVEPFRPPAKSMASDRRMGALSKLTKKFSHRKNNQSQSERDDISGRGSSAWEYNQQMEKKASENWVGGMPEGLAALSQAGTTAADARPRSGNKQRNKKKAKESQDAFSPGGPVEGVGFGRKISGQSSVLGIFSETHQPNPYQLNTQATGADGLDESWFERKAADGLGSRSKESSLPRSPSSKSPPPPPPPPGPPPPPPPVPESEYTAVSPAVAAPAAEANVTAAAAAARGGRGQRQDSLSDLYAKPTTVPAASPSADASNLYSEPFAGRARSPSTRDQPPAPETKDQYSLPFKPGGVQAGADKPKITLSDYTTDRKGKSPIAAGYAEPIPKSKRQTARLRETEGQDSVSTIASSAKARKHIDRLVGNDISAMLADSGDDTMSEMSAFRSATTLGQTPATLPAPKAQPPAGNSSTDVDDPFGLSELALALQMAGEEEYWKESLSMDPGTEAKLVPEFKSSAAVEASAAAAVVFDESILDPSKSTSAQKQATQPVQGTLASPGKATAASASNEMMAMVAALSSFGDDDDSATVASQPSVPARMSSMPHQETKVVKGKNKSSWINASSSSKLNSPAATSTSTAASTKSASIRVSTSSAPNITMVSLEQSQAAKAASTSAGLLAPEPVNAQPGTPGAARKMWKQMTKKPSESSKPTASPPPPPAPAPAPMPAPAAAAAVSSSTSASALRLGYRTSSTSNSSIPKSTSATFSPKPVVNSVKAPVVSQMNARSAPPPPASSETQASAELAKVFERRRTKAAQNAFLDKYKQASVDILDT